MKLLIPVLFLAVSGMLFFGYVNQAYGRIQILRAEVAQYDQALSRSRELQEVRDQLLARFNAFPQRGKDRLEKLVPDHIDNVRLILDFDAMASRYGMHVRNVSTDTPEGRNSPDQIGPTEERSEFVVLSFSVAGTYDTFRRFLDDLERSLRLVDIVGLSFSSNETGTYEYRISLTTYWLRP